MTVTRSPTADFDRLPVLSHKPGDGLTPRQRFVLRLIRDAIVQRGMPPTIREIMDATGINSPNGVVVHLRRLVAKGYITVDTPRGGGNIGAKARGIRLVGAVVRLEYSDDEAGRKLREALEGGEQS